MSLKAFHFFFIFVATVFTLWLGVWAGREYMTTKDVGSLVMGIVSVVGGLVLIVYARWVLRKLRSISFV